MKKFGRLLKYIASYKRNVILNVICNILMTIFNIVTVPLLIPFLQILFGSHPKVLTKPQFSYDVDSMVQTGYYYISQTIEQNGQKTALAYICIGFILLFFLKNLFSYLSLFFMAPVRTGIVRDIRMKLFNKMIYLPLSYFSEEKKGDLMARMSSDVQEIESSILNFLEVMVREPLMIIGCLCLMVVINPHLTLFVIGLLLVTGLFIGRIGKSLRQSSGKAQGHLGNLIAMLEESLSGLRIIKGFNADKYQAQRFEKENNSYRDTFIKIMWKKDLASPLSEFLGIVVVSILLWYASGLIFNNQMSAEGLFAFLLAFFYAQSPAKSFSKAFATIQKGMASVDRVEKILNTPNNIREKKNAIKQHTFSNSILYQDVHFSYIKNKPVLTNINIEIQKGKTIALVGGSGAGKSTLVDLLPRFYDINEGSIFIDGINIKNFSLEALRSMMGIVTQQSILFNDTIFNNITFGLQDIPKESVIEAAKIANAHEFIMDAEKGYETIIGDGGGKLSGGQRQRLTIARAVLRNPPILILDEATSALDSESEKLVQDALQKVMQNRTAIVIAHRLSTIQDADEIIVMREGKIIERGSHQKLLDVNGAYHKLVEFQTF